MLYGCNFGKFCGLDRGHRGLDLQSSLCKINVKKQRQGIEIRYHHRFFDQVGHQITYASIGNKHFFTKSCHRQTYQNDEQPPQRLQNSYFQSHFSASKINRIFLIFFL